YRRTWRRRRSCGGPGLASSPKSCGHGGRCLCGCSTRHQVRCRLDKTDSDGWHYRSHERLQCAGTERRANEDSRRGSTPGAQTRDGSCGRAGWYQVRCSGRRRFHRTRDTPRRRRRRFDGKEGHVARPHAFGNAEVCNDGSRERLGCGGTMATASSSLSPRREVPNPSWWSFSRAGKVPLGFKWPKKSQGSLISPAITVAMLGAIESLMSAVVSDRMSGGKHNPNVELVGQGVVNILSPLFGGLPATGAIARTATNIRSGAKTPVAGMVHALTLLAIVVFAAPLARFIPLSVLAAILLMVAYNMGEWQEIPELLKQSKFEIAAWLVTFLLTVFADLTVAVEAGMILAVLVFIRKVTQTTTVSEVTAEYIR